MVCRVTYDLLSIGRINVFRVIHIVYQQGRDIAAVNGFQQSVIAEAKRVIKSCQEVGPAFAFGQDQQFVC